jgi:hypothetical protein
LFPIFCILFLTIEKKWALIDLKKIIWTIFFGLLFSSPVILWNVSNGFQSFAFQFKHGLGRTHWKPEWTITYFLGQFAAIFPIPAIIALRAKLKDHDRLHYYLGFGPILFFGITSYRGVVEANWPDVGYFSIYSLFFIASTNLKPAARTISIWIAIYLLIFFQYNYSFFNINTDKLREPFKYQALIPTVNKYQPLYGGTYQMSSTLWYLTKKPFYKFRGFNRFDFFDQGIPIYLLLPYKDTPRGINPDIQSFFGTRYSFTIAFWKVQRYPCRHQRGCNHKDCQQAGHHID